MWVSPKVRERKHCQRSLRKGVVTGGISRIFKFSRISRKWSDAPFLLQPGRSLESLESLNSLESLEARLFWWGRFVILPVLCLLAFWDTALKSEFLLAFGAPPTKKGCDNDTFRAVFSQHLGILKPPNNAKQGKTQNDKSTLFDPLTGTTGGGVNAGRFGKIVFWPNFEGCFWPLSN